MLFCLFFAKGCVWIAFTECLPRRTGIDGIHLSPRTGSLNIYEKKA